MAMSARDSACPVAIAVMLLMLLAAPGRTRRPLPQQLQRQQQRLVLAPAGTTHAAQAAAVGSTGRYKLTAASFEHQLQQQQRQQQQEYLGLATSSSRARAATGRSLKVAAPPAQQQQQPRPLNPLCVATVNYGAGVGDIGNEHVAAGPVFLGSVNVVMLETAAQGAVSSWVLGWQFAAGERILQDRDVFGDLGRNEVRLVQAQQQGVAVFSNRSILPGSQGQAAFSFVGRKGANTTSSAPFRVAPPAHMFLNNLFCWPLFRPSPAAAAAAGAGSTSSNGSTVLGRAAAAASTAADQLLGAARGAPPAAQQQQQEQPQQQQVAVAVPQLLAAQMPQRLLVEYSPVDIMPTRMRGPGWFFFRLSNGAPAGGSTSPIYLDQVALQYWFQGPQQAAEAAAAASDSSATSSLAAQADASQLSLGCQDAGAPLSCSSIKWSISPGLPGVFGARFMLKMWFSMQQPGSNSSTNGSVGNSGPDALPVRYQLLPKGSTPSNTTAVAYDPAVGSFLVQQITAAQAIVYISQRPPSENINQQQDYSFSDTAVIGPANATTTTSSSSNNSRPVIIRHAVQLNPHMPAFLDNQLAWGSPPTARQVTVDASTTASSSSSGSRGINSSLPPGSYCTWNEQSRAMSCGIDVTYCCLGSWNLSSGVPADWNKRLVVDQPAADPVSNATAAAANLTAGLALAANSSSNASMGAEEGSRAAAREPYVVALSVALPVLAVLAAVVIITLLRWKRRRVGRRSGSMQESAGAGGAGSISSLLDLNNPSLPASSRATSSNPSHSSALLSRSRKLAAATVPLLAPAGNGDGANSSSSKQHLQDPAGLGAGACSPFAQPLWQEQLELQQQLDADACKAAAAAAGAAVPAEGASLGQVAGSSGSQGRSLVPMWLMRGRTMPADLLARALDQIHSAQQQLQQEGEGPAAAGGAVGKRSSNSPEPPDPPLKRCATWADRLHEDAFGEDLLGNLVKMTSSRRHKPLSPIGSGSYSVTAAAAQAGIQHNGVSASTAAAVMAAVAAIGASLVGGGTATAAAAASQQQQVLLLPQHDSHSKASAALAVAPTAAPWNVSSVLQGTGPVTAAAASVGDAAPASSFLQALMAGSGVIHPPNGPPIPLNVDFASEVQLGRLLGRGGFGNVYEATWRGQQVAVKLLIVDTEAPSVLDAFLKEVALCACLRGSSRVVKLLGACLGEATAQQQHRSATASSASLAADLEEVMHAPTDAAQQGRVRRCSSSQYSAGSGQGGSRAEQGTTADNGAAGSSGHAHQQRQLALIMELVEGGNLSQRIYHPSKRRLSTLEVLQIGRDVARGLAYLHPAVVHRDLKPHNVLLEANGRVKIADFGISRFKDPSRSWLSVTQQGGTPNYMAPELFNGSRVDEATDVYSLGCILYECVARKRPFADMMGNDGRSFNLLFKIIVAVAINKQRPVLPASTPPRLADLISRCWQEEPRQRPRAAAVAAELQDMMQEEVELRASMLRAHRLAAATRSRSLPLPGFDLSSSSASNSKLGSRESSADATAALEHALTLHNPGAAAAELGLAAAGLEPVAAAAAAAPAAGPVTQQRAQPGSSSDYYCRAKACGGSTSSSKGGGDGSGNHVTFMHAQHNITNPAAAAAALAALDARPSALYTAAAGTLGAFGKSAAIAAAAAGAAEEGAVRSSSSQPQVSLALPCESSSSLQEQLWAAACGPGERITAAPAPSVLQAMHTLRSMLTKQRDQQPPHQHAVVGSAVAAASPAASLYASAESHAEVATPAAAAGCVPTLPSSSCSTRPVSTRRTLTNLAAPRTPILRDLVSGCAATTSTAGMHNAAAGSPGQEALHNRHGSSSSSSDGSSRVSSGSGGRRLKFSPVACSALLQPVTPACIQQQQQQVASLPSAVSLCYADALDQYCGPVSTTDQRQQHLRHGRQRRVSWHRDLAPRSEVLQTGASGDGNSSSHSTSTASAFQSACSLWNPADGDTTAPGQRAV